MMDWDIHKKGPAAEILQYATMSSDESDFEIDGDGNSRVIGYTVKHLSWESDRVKKVKRRLDRAYARRLSRRARERVLPRRDAPILSNRSPPENLPGWATLDQ